ncbi:hypothetical protein [Streptomyces sp. Go-475]|uniref:hypothetical protein n=1 Tax=Streptomyces sp. Go-475 TaxID=2072505 RepID=UPI000DF0CD52|nr:hypothetical protein [Streptomyces sp. Go-475]AXE86788.1 hypothetical protein C1703_17415 [Streptomyces sp. Go-475]
MAESQLSAASPSAHPMANPGYGKRSVPDQLPGTPHDFVHLPPREAAIAAYLDRLPDGADISVKTLAKQLPYGQCALSTALNRIQQAGHLRRGRECVTADDGSSRWITRSWWSRTARDDDWWTAFTRGDAPRPQTARPTRSRAHILLAALGRTAPVLSLSESDCATLAPLVTDWFQRGASEDDVLRALTAGLPTPVHHPASLVRNRLTSKLPPPPDPRPPLRVLECANCGAPGRPESLPGGRCSACRGEHTPARPPAPLSAPKVHDRAAQIRAAISQRRQEKAHT